MAVLAAALAWSAPAFARGRARGVSSGKHTVKTYAKKNGTVVTRHSAKNPR